MSDKKEKPVEGEFLGHAACPCGESSDACAIYKKEDENGTEKIDGFCWSCNKYVTPEQVADAGGVKSISKKKMSPEEEERIMKEISEKEFRGWKDRKINKQTSEFYGVRCDMSDEPGEPAVRYYPVFKEVDSSDQLVGYKKRTVEGKRFSVIGKCNNTCKLFGQNLFQAGGKFLVITGGEEDAMAVFQTLRNQDKGFITPVVSPTCGETAAAVQIKSNYEYITSFEKIVIMMDNDEVGNKAAEAIARLLKPGQAYMAKLRRKDPCEHIKEGELSEIRQAFWKAEKFCPAGIVKLSQMWSAFENESNNEMIPFPPAFGNLNDMMAGGMERGEITTLGALTSIGKGQPLWENVVTPNGYRKVGDIKLGDKLIGSDGREISVVGIFPQGKQKVYRVTLSDGSVAHCDENHLWRWQTEYQFRENDKYQVTTVKDIIEHMKGSGRNKVLLPPNPSVKWKEKELPIDPWLLGVILGDGSTGGCITVTNTESDIIERVREKVYDEGCELNEYRDIQYRIAKRKELIPEEGVCNRLKRKLSKMGLSDTNSVNKFIPDVYMTSSEEQRLALLQGLFDTDGSVTNNTANLEYSTTSKRLAEQVKFLCRSLGFTARVVQRESFYTKGNERTQVNDSYRVFIKQPEGVFAFTSEKHNSRFKQGRTFARNIVQSIEEVSYEDTVCFKVDAPDELYLTNDFIVTHNTTIISHIVYHLLKHTDLKVGAMYLEGTQREVVRDLLSIDIRQNLRKVPKGNLNMPALRKDFFDGIASDDNFVFVDHQGALNADDMFEKLTFLAKAEGCDVIVVDPIQAAVPSDNNGAIIDFMDRTLKLAKNTNCAILSVSHMRKPESKDPHDVNEYDLLGSSALNQISFNTILVSRDKMSDDDEIRNSTLVQLVKCRRTGETGKCGWIRFDNNTCMIYERDDPYENAGLRKLENEEYEETQSGNHFEEEGSPVEADDSFDGMK